jgi:hypothetical protein
MSAATCKERATPPDSPKRPALRVAPLFSPLQRCSSVTDRRGYALSSRLGETKNRQQRGMAEYLNRLLGTRDRFVIFAAILRLNGDVNQFVMST